MVPKTLALAGGFFTALTVDRASTELYLIITFVGVKHLT